MIRLGDHTAGRDNNTQLLRLLAATGVIAFHSRALSGLSWKVENNDRITLVADKESYAPGDVAHVLVPSPFAITL